MFKKKFNIFEREFIKKWDEYRELHKRLDAYRGKEIGDDTTLVNDLVRSIQKTFIDMYPFMQFTLERHQLFTHAIHEYNKFIEDLKKAGATEEKVEA